MSSTNPLKAYARTPKIYVKLPSLGKTYSPDNLKTSVTGEVGVRAMTAKDEIIMNNPDALLNGDAVFETIASCVDIKNPTSLLVPDVELILLAMRYATKGDTLSFAVKCPHCGSENEEKMSIRELLDAASTLEDIEEPHYHEIIAEGKPTIRVNLAPSPYSDVTATNIVLYEQGRLLQFLASNDELPQEKKNEVIRKSYTQLADLHLRILINSIESVDIIDGEVVSKVVNKDHIREFINDISANDADKIKEKMEVLNKIGLPPSVKVRCEAVSEGDETKTPCGHEFDMEVKFDPSNFFADIFLASEAKK